MTPPSRAHGIDAMRLIGSFCIILIHSSFGIIPESWVDFFRLISRWAVPFFFVASGYFLNKRRNESGDLPLGRIEPNLNRLIGILLASALVYFPVKAAMGFDAFRIDQLLVGNYFHLWFVGALLVGTIGQWFFRQLGGRRLLDIISLGLILAALFSDSYDLFFDVRFNYEPFRLLLGIPMVHLGMRIAANGRSGSGPRFWFAIAALGMLLQFGEAYWLSKKFDYPVYEHQLLVGTLICAIPLFIGSSLIAMRENALVRWGREYSLAIYLYHPLVFYLLALLGNRFWPDSKMQVESFSPLIAFFASLFVLMGIHRFMPRLFRFLNGDLKAIWSANAQG